MSAEVGSGQPLLALKGHPSQVADIQQWKKNDSAVAMVKANGEFESLESIAAPYLYARDPGGDSYYGPGDTQIQSIDPTYIPFSVYGAVGQNAPLVQTVAGVGQTSNQQEWLSSAGSLLASVSATGVMRVPYLKPDQFLSPDETRHLVLDWSDPVDDVAISAYGGPSNTIRLSNIKVGGFLTQSAPAFGTGTPSRVLTWGGPGMIGEVMVQPASGVGDFVQWRNSASTTLSSVGADGKITAPAFVSGPAQMAYNSGNLFFQTSQAGMGYVWQSSSANVMILNTSLGDLELTKPGRGLTVTSPDGATKKTLTINNAGALTLV